MTLPDTTAPAPAGPKRIPFVTDLFRLARVLFSPTAVFEEQREAPTFWIPWLVVSILMLVVTTFSFPYTLAVARLGATAQGRPFPASAEGIMRVTQYVAVPVVMLIIFLLVAAVMYVVLLATGGEARFKGLMTVAVFTGLLGVLQGVLMLVVLKLRDPTTMQTVADYQVSFGLDLLLPQDASLGKFVDGLLKGVSPISIWGLVINAIGIRTMEKTTKGAAWTAAGVAFILTLCLAGVGNLMSGGR
jgi:hypothetical protein